MDLLEEYAVTAWGSNDHGQCAVPDTVAGFVPVAAGMWHSLGLTEDGRIIARAGPKKERAWKT
jgi:alpha-tubulin suppressor-like RCC1 family protein